MSSHPRPGLPLVLAVSLVWVTACEETPPPTAPDETPVEKAEASSAQQDQSEEKVLFARSAAGGEKVRVILELASMADQQAVATQARSQESDGVTLLRQYHRFPLLAVEVGEDALQTIQQSPLVVSWMEDVPEPPALDASIPFINGDDVHDLGLDGNGFVVAILDTGIDPDHPFLGGRVVSQACFSSDDAGTATTTLCPDGTTSQTTGNAARIDIPACNNGPLCDHGTHVAGIAAGDGTGVVGAPATGVAPGADIVAIQVFTRFNTSTPCNNAGTTAPCILTFPADQIAALQRVLDLADGTAASLDLVAANMSLGGGANASACDGDARKTPIDALLAAEIATVISAGNQGFDNQVSTPGCISTAVTVGSVNESDQLFFDNRGPLLDLFAPGRGIVSSEEAGTFGTKSGTSMAAPHVTGAYAVLRQEWPSLSASEILSLLQDNGVDLTYTSGGGTATTPRLDLLAAVQGTTDPPALGVDHATITVDEGLTATNGGTVSDDETVAGDLDLSASIGTVVNDGDGTWSWSFDSSDGPDESQTVTITAADEKLVTGDVTFDLIVENVAPTLTIAPDQLDVIDEGDALTVSADLTDPGVDDEPFTAEIVCFDLSSGDLTIAGSVTVTDAVAPDLEGAVTATCDMGDTSESGDPPSGTFTVTVSVADKDGGADSDDFELEVNNVAPTVAIDLSVATDVGGTPTFIARAGDPVDFSADVTDPGSDDLFLEWDWGDGSTDAADYLANPPMPDAFPSPDLDPRLVTDEQTNAWTGACLFGITLTALDDDGGTGADAADVVIGGTADRTRGAGFWKKQYRGNGRSAFDDPTLACFLQIADHMSAVFSEAVDADSKPDAADVLFLKGNSGSMEEILDAQLLAVWLNFANGAFAHDEMVDTTGDGAPDTPFSDAVTTAESVRLDPGATRSELEEQKDILEAINSMDG